jgi:hypothetical protein
VASNQLRSLGVLNLGVSGMVRMECLFYPHSVRLRVPSRTVPDGHCIL